MIEILKLKGKHVVMFGDAIITTYEHLILLKGSDFNAKVIQQELWQNQHNKKQEAFFRLKGEKNREFVSFEGLLRSYNLPTINVKFTLE